MPPVIVESKDLPEVIARKLKGQKVEVVETDEGVLLRSVSDSIPSLRGLLKDTGFTTEEFMKMKQEEKDLER